MSSGKVQKMVTVKKADGTTFRRRQWVNADSAKQNASSRALLHRANSNDASKYYVFDDSQQVAPVEYSKSMKMQGYYPYNIATALEESVTRNAVDESANRYMATLTEQQRAEVSDIVNDYLDVLRENDAYQEDAFQQYSRELKTKLNTFESTPEITEHPDIPILGFDPNRQASHLQQRKQMFAEKLEEAKEIGYLPRGLQVEIKERSFKDGNKTISLHFSGEPVEFAQTSGAYHYGREMVARIHDVIENCGESVFDRPETIGRYGTEFNFQS